MEESHSRDLAAYKVLPVFKSPVIGRRDCDKSSKDDLFPKTLELEYEPKFITHEDSSKAELFYDLFFAANYTVFSEIDSITDVASLKSHIGYFSMLWMTWILVSLYDVRYLTDSIFERALRAVHLGVMVGFSVVTPKYDPDNNDIHTFRVMSIILFVSRLVLCIQYGGILWHVRRYRKARQGVYAQVGTHAIAALIYLGVSFSFDESNTTVGKGYYAWYVVSATEAVCTLVLSNGWIALSFTDTHLMPRLTSVTLIILGDGVGLLAKEVSTIVDAPGSWDSTTLGLVASTASSIYLIYLLYFDWMTHDKLKAWRQQLWTILHYPAHLAMVLFIEGFVQYVVWGKIQKTTFYQMRTNFIIDDAKALPNLTSKEAGRNMSGEVNRIFAKLPPTHDETRVTLADAVDNITNIPDWLWPRLSPTNFTGWPSEDVERYNNLYSIYASALSMVSVAVDSAAASVYDAQGVDAITSKLRRTQPNITAEVYTTAIVEKTADRYVLISRSNFFTAGCALASLTLLSVVSHQSCWTRLQLTRVAICLLLSLVVITVVSLGIGLGDHYGDSDGLYFVLLSPLSLPTLAAWWFAALLVTHVGNAVACALHRKRQHLEKELNAVGTESPQMHSAASEQALEAGSQKSICKGSQRFLISSSVFPSDLNRSSSGLSQ